MGRPKLTTKKKLSITIDKRLVKKIEELEVDRAETLSAKINELLYIAIQFYLTPRKPVF